MNEVQRMNKDRTGCLFYCIVFIVFAVVIVATVVIWKNVLEADIPRWMKIVLLLR